MPSIANDYSSDKDATAAVADALVEKIAEAKKKPKPPCPSIPKEIPTAPPGWRVLRFQRPKCCLNAMHEWGWTFFYYLNKKTHKTRHFPPIDDEEEDEEMEMEDTTTIDLTRPRPNSSTLFGHFLRTPTEEAFAREENGDLEPEPMIVDNEGNGENVPFHE